MSQTNDLDTQWPAEDEEPGLKKFQSCLLYVYAVHLVKQRAFPAIIPVDRDCIKFFLNAIQPPQTPDSCKSVLKILWGQDQGVLRYFFAFV